MSVNVSCVDLNVSEARIIEIYYDENKYTDYFYIFTGESNGKYCGNNNSKKPTTNNFKLNIPQEFKKTIEIKFEPSIGDDDNDYCVLYEKIYYCNGTSTENPANVRITIDSSSYIFPLENISNAIHNSFSSVESSLVASKLFIKHFCSDTNQEDRSNIQGKFSEAAYKAITFFDSMGYNSPALDNLRENLVNGTFPGLGVLKKISILHHRPVVDYDKPFAQFLNISKIMCCKNDRRISDFVNLFDELSKGILG